MAASFISPNISYDAKCVIPRIGLDALACLFLLLFSCSQLLSVGIVIITQKYLRECELYSVYLRRRRCISDVLGVLRRSVGMTCRRQCDYTFQLDDERQPLPASSRTALFRSFRSLSTNFRIPINSTTTGITSIVILLGLLRLLMFLIAVQLPNFS